MMSDGPSLNGDDGERNGKTVGAPKVRVPFEIEEETLSLMDETIDRAPHLRKRTNAMRGEDGQNSSESGVLGFLRGNSTFAYTLRNVCILGTLAAIVIFFFGTMEHSIEEYDKDPKRVHQSSFGGSNNPGYSNFLPQSNVGEHVDSISVANAQNFIGHYWHDPYKSPFASYKYDVEDEILEMRQTDFEMSRNQTKRIFGSWNFSDPHKEKPRTHVSFRGCPLRDCETTSGFFQDHSWQIDLEYVKGLIHETKLHVKRVTEGIYQEYGHGSFNDTSTKSDDELKERDGIFRVITKDFELNDNNIPVDPDSKEKLKGIAYINPNAWDALVRKILHCIITGSDLFVVTVGDGATAGHGNNFLMSPIMQFHYLMEPVLDFLGIQLISRNMAMKEPASIVAGAMAGADIFGEADILWYHTASPEGKVSEGVQDLLYKQAILSGDHVPLILTDSPGSILHDSSGEAWIGSLLKNDEICGAKKGGVCNMSVHDSVCWVDRKGVVLQTKQSDKVADEDKYPGRRAHQLEARKLSLVLLAGIGAALDKWSDQVEKDGVPLADEHWHIGGAYDRVREAVRTFQKPDYKSPCEDMMKNLSMICHLEMHGNTEWTPRVKPSVHSFQELLPSDFELDGFATENVFTDFDLLPFEWEVPPDQVDPHLIAISTSVPPPPLFYEVGEVRDEEEEDGQTSRDKEQQQGSNLRWRYAKSRRLEKSNAQIVPGKGWTFHNTIAGVCDGSAQSWCGRDISSSCLMAGHNDNKAGLLGDALSGWLWLRVKNVKEGLIFARFDTAVEANSDQVTEGWNGVNNKNERRRLHLPDDLLFDYSINNGEVTTLSKQGFLDWGIDVADGMTLYPLLVDREMEKEKHDGVDLDVTIRIRSEQKRAATLLLTHLYYA